MATQGKHLTKRGRRQLVALIEALRPLGLTGTAAEVVQAIAPVVGANSSYGLRIRKSMIQTILRDAQHQAIINSVIHAGMKREGYEAHYRAFYPDYCRLAAEAGFPPVSCRTFQNRALAKQLWWEKNTPAPSTPLIPHAAVDTSSLPQASGE